MYQLARRKSRRYGDQSRPQGDGSSTSSTTHVVCSSSSRAASSLFPCKANAAYFLCGAATEIENECMPRKKKAHHTSTSNQERANKQADGPDTPWYFFLVSVGRDFQLALSVGLDRKSYTQRSTFVAVQDTSRMGTDDVIILSIESRQTSKNNGLTFLFGKFKFCK